MGLIATIYKHKKVWCNVKIGIIGCGKMGQEIMEIFLDSSYDIVWLAKNREKENKYISFILKKLKRIGRRNAWSKEEVDIRKNNIHVSYDINDLANSDFVIETVIENLEIKNNIFQKLQKIVSDDCIFLTNTSSIQLDYIFNNVLKKERCAGLHFFYPCKIINTVEINTFFKTSDKCVVKIKELLDSLERRYIILHNDASLFFSKIINILMSEAYNIYSENVLTYKEIDDIIKDKFMMMGIFEILNSTGNAIVYNCINNFAEKKNKYFHERFRKLAYDIHTNYGDCQFEKYVQVNESQFKQMKVMSKDEKEIYKEYVLLRVQALFINYITYAVKNMNIDKKELIYAYKDILGIMKEPKEMLDDIGENKVSDILNKNYENINCELYKRQDYSIWYM